MSDMSLDDSHEILNFIRFKEFPVHINVIQNFKHTLDELLDEQEYEITEDEWLSILFQIIYSLIVAQKYYSFCHNDLHSSNIMFEPSSDEFLYYNIYGKIYKIKTFGKIVKIIDFGRGSFHFNNEWFLSNVFNSDGDADGQYTYPKQHTNLDKTYKPVNYSFDLIRLATTIYERLDDFKKIRKMLDKWMMDDFGDNVIDEPDDFDLYIHIARYCHNAVPLNVVKHRYFEQFTINKLPEDVDKKIYFVVE